MTMHPFFIKTREPFRCLNYIVFLLTWETGVSCGYLHTVRELTNDEKCYWKKISPGCIVTPYCLGVTQLDWSDHGSHGQSQQRRCVVIKLTMCVNHKWHKFVQTITTLPASEWWCKYTMRRALRDTLQLQADTTHCCVFWTLNVKPNTASGPKLKLKPQLSTSVLWLTFFNTECICNWCKHTSAHICIEFYSFHEHSLLTLNNTSCSMVRERH